VSPTAVPNSAKETVHLSSGRRIPIGCVAPRAGCSRGCALPARQWDDRRSPKLQCHV